jgi:hypothetical protein
MSRRSIRNRPHWLRMVRIFRAVYGSSWRRSAEKWFELGQGQLRAAIDREMTHDEVWRLDESLMEMTRRYCTRLAGRMEHIANLSDDVAIERERRTRAKVRKSHDVTWAELWVGNSAEAAFRQMYPGWLESEEATT